MNQIDIDTIPYNSTGTSTTLPNNNNSNFDGGVGVTDDHNNNHDNNNDNNDNNDNNNASKKSRKPVNYAFTQQRLRAWQPILRPPYVIAAFLILTAIFIPLGVVLLLASKSVIEYTVPYTNSCTMTRNETLGGAMHCEATIPFTVLKTMKPPVYIYYKLENFFQNHRRYAESRSDDQLSGNANSKKASVSDSCSPIVTYGSKGPVINPCGLIAWSMFNDTFTLTTANTSATGGGGSGGDDDDDTIVVCDTVTETGCTKKGISWSSDRSVKFRPPKTTNFTNWMHPLTYYNESSHVIPEVTDEDFIVWMRTAALPNFRKLHRIIKTTVHPGKYELHVNQNFPVTQFSGKKSFVMTTSSWIGGKNYFLAIAYLVVGGVCFVLAIIFAVGMVVQKIIAASNNRTA